jgi:hypothetical protein
MIGRLEIEDDNTFWVSEIESPDVLDVGIVSIDSGSCVTHIVSN